MINDIKNTAKDKMTKAIEALKTNLSKIRTGRAHPAPHRGVLDEHDQYESLKG